MIVIMAELYAGKTGEMGSITLGVLASILDLDGYQWGVRSQVLSFRDKSA
jgi:hypothetical protein